MATASMPKKVTQKANPWVHPESRHRYLPSLHFSGGPEIEVLSDGYRVGDTTITVESAAPDSSGRDCICSIVRSGRVLVSERTWRTYAEDQAKETAEKERYRQQRWR